MSIEEPFDPNHPPESVQTNEPITFDAISALAQTYAKAMGELASASAPRLLFKKLRADDALNWMDTEALLKTSTQEIVNVVEVAKFGATGWVNLRRMKDKSGSFAYALQLVDSVGNKEVAISPVDHVVIAESILRGISPLAAAMASDPEFRKRVKALVLHENKHADYEANVLDGFIEQVEFKSAAGGKRI